MKNIKALSFGILSLLVLQLALVACDKPKEREETIDKSIQENLVQISDLHDITSDSTKAYFYKETPNKEITLTSQIQANETIMRVLSLIKNTDSKKALDEQMAASGLIAFAIMTDKVEVYKVLTKAKADDDSNIHSAVGLLDIKKLKKQSLEDGNMSVAQLDLTDSKSDIRYIKIASIKIAKSGVLENKKTKYYDEKTSVLTVGDRPLDVSTHLLLEPETTTEQKSEK